MEDKKGEDKTQRRRFGMKRYKEEIIHKNINESSMHLSSILSTNGSTSSLY